MKKILLTLTLLGSAYFAGAQVICAGISPAPIAQNYLFTYAEPDGGWGVADLTIPNTFVQDTLIAVDDLSGAAGNQGCNSSPVGAYAGKIAVVFRGSCQFGTKAKNAELAGAVGVIIINNTAAAPIPMAGGTDGGSVTVPTIMMTQADGNALLAEMANGPVVMFIGNKTGFYQNDIGYQNGNVSFSKYSSVNKMTAQNASEYSFKVGGRLYNYGQAAQTNVVVNAKVTHAGSTVYDNTTTPAPIAIGDSIDFMLPDFSLATYPVGRYKLTYTTTMDNADEYAGDNTLSYEFIVSDTLFSYVKLDTVLNSPVTGNGSRPSGNYTSYKQCINYSDPNASRVGVAGIYFNFATNASDSILLPGQEFVVSVSRWDDVFTDLNDAAFTNAGSFNNVIELANGFYYYPNVTSEDSTVYAQFDNQVVLEDNKRYLFCVTPSENKIFFGMDDSYDYTWNLETYLQPINPLNVEGGTGASPWSVAGFGSETQPSIQVRMFPAAQLGIKELNTIEGSAYPNPMKDNVTISVAESGNATVVVTDLAGKVVATNNVVLVNGKANVATDNLQSGMYIFNVALENGKTAQFNVVKQ